MTDSAVSDQRVRKRISTIIGSGLTAVGVTTKRNPDIVFANRHYVTIMPAPTTAGATALTAGVVSIRAEPVGQVTVGGILTNVSGYSPVGIEAVNVATATQFTFVVNGFFDAFMVNITTLVTGGSITVVVNSTIEN